MSSNNDILNDITSNATPPPTITLSRSTYPLNSSILGSIHIPSSLLHQSSISSIQFYIAGRVRLDTRWRGQEDVSSLLNYYGSHPCHDDLHNYNYIHQDTASTSTNTMKRLNIVEDLVVESYVGALSKRRVSIDPTTTNSSSGSSSSTIKTNSHDKLPHLCFWSTNVITLYQNGESKVIPITTTTTTFGTNFSNYYSSENHDAGLMTLEKSDWFHCPLFSKQNDNDDCHDDENISSDLVLETCSHEYDSLTDIQQQQQHVDNDDPNSKMSNSPPPATNTTTNNYGSNHNNTHSNNCHINNTSSSSTTTTTNMTNHTTHNQKISSTSLVSAEEEANYTFRTDLPNDLPPTANTASARYFYSAVLVIHRHDQQVIVYQAPFTVITTKSNYLTTNSDCSPSQPKPTHTKLQVSTLHIASHPQKRSLLNLSPSSTDELKPWSITVQKSNGGWDTSNIRTLSIEDCGKKCCQLTILGGKVMHPGEKILLQFDFMNLVQSFVMSDSHNDDESSYHDRILPCHLISACLQGEENTIALDGSMKRTRTYLFDTDYSTIHPSYTESVSLSLLLPLNAPVTLQTNLVEVSISCRIDVTVQVTPMGVESGENVNPYKVLTVQFPCVVVTDTEVDEQESEGDLSMDLQRKIVQLARGDVDKSPNHVKDVCHILSPEVLNDLTMLSLHARHSAK